MKKSDFTALGLDETQAETAAEAWKKSWGEGLAEYVPKAEYETLKTSYDAVAADRDTIKGERDGLTANVETLNGQVAGYETR